MNDFPLWFRLGLHHIADLRAYDHILFVTALTVAYRPAEWRRLAVLVTAFTLGHSLTLALATLEAVRVPSALVEALIPATIVATAVAAIAGARHDRAAAPPRMTWRYLLAGGFGLVHGLGFSGYLRSLLGGEESLVGPLFAFNVGLEAGQLAIVFVVLVAGVLAERVARLERRDWVLVVSGAATGIGGVMLIERTVGG
jgi:hypothetical protein